MVVHKAFPLVHINVKIVLPVLGIQFSGFLRHGSAGRNVLFAEEVLTFVELLHDIAGSQKICHLSQGLSIDMFRISLVESQRIGCKI